MNLKMLLCALQCLLFLFSLLCVTGCNTRYGCEYIEMSSIQAAAPVLHKLELECKLNVKHMQVKELQKRTLRDFCHTVRTGEKDYFKEYCGYSEKEKAILVPMRNAFPCITWGMTMITGKFPMASQSNWDYIGDYWDTGVKAWGPLIGFGAIANLLLGTGDLVYYVAGSVWSLIAIPSYYVWNRATCWTAPWQYRSNKPNGFYTFISSPFINLFVPSYIPPYLNDGPMQTRVIKYEKPVKLKAVLTKEIPQTLKRDLKTGTQVTLQYRGKNFQTKTLSAGRIVLPFKIYPLPARKEKLVIEVKKYKSKFQEKPADIRTEFSFNTIDYLSPAERKLYNTARDSSQNYLHRYRAVYGLKKAILPEDFKKFETDPAQLPIR